MLKQLKKRLQLIYMVTTDLLLITIIIILFWLNQEQFKENNIKNFEENIQTITEKIAYDKSVSYSWLSKMEAENHLIISVSSNTIPLGYIGAWEPLTDRQILFDKLGLYSEKTSNFSAFTELYEEVERSPVFSFYGDQEEHYYGSSYIRKSMNKILYIEVIQWMENEPEYYRKQIIFFGMVIIAGLAGVCIISLLIVNKSLIPLKDGLHRQNEFVAAASHELRSPLTVIMAGIGNLKSKNAVAEEIIPCIEREGDRMARLINDMLLIASSDAKTWDLHIEEINLETFFINTYESLSQICQKKKQQLTLELPDEELMVFTGDRLRMEQILIILVDNASSYSPEGTKVTIQVHVNKKYLTIKVKDHGCGIKEEDKKRIFERFARLDHSRNDKKHFGLGLSIAIELINLHRGVISVKDTTGGGSTFVVELPVIKQRKT